MSEPLARRELEDELPTLLELDRIRQAATSLRDAGLKAILHAKAHEADKEEEVWEHNEDVDVESADPRTCSPSNAKLQKILLRRVKHLGWITGHVAVDDPVEAVPELPGITLDELFNDPMSVLLAANYLRAALDEPGSFLKKEVFLAYYRVIRELYFVDSPGWSLGGARAGTRNGRSGRESSFVTSECARALGMFMLKLTRTAEFVERVGKTFAYADRLVLGMRLDKADPERIGGLPPHWCDVELERVMLGLRITFSAAKGNVLFDVTPTESDHSVQEGASLPEEELKRLRRWFDDALAGFVKGSGKQITEAVESIRDFRRTEEVRKDRDDKSKEAREYNLSHSAHEKAQLAVKKILWSSDSLSTVGSIDSRKLAHGLRQGADGIRLTLTPTLHFADSIVQGALATQCAEQRIVDSAEVVFAAVCGGAISGRWGLPLYMQAIEMLSQAVNDSGAFPSGRPYQLGDRGAQYTAENSQAIRAFLQLLEHTPVDASPDVLWRFVRFFDEGAIDLPGGRIGWGRGLRTYRPVACRTSTALAVLTLSRLVTALDHKINRQVKRHFVVRGPRELANVPDFDRLMCTDVGLAAVAQKAGRKRPMISSYLECMRAHLLGKRAVEASGEQNVFSVILYGPPGTGKTTLVESLAKTYGTDLVCLSPSDFLVGGLDNLERRATAIMQSLSLLTRGVILFDEFDSVLHTRESADRPKTVFDFLPGSMLPKFTALNSAAKKQRVVYVLATNYIDRLDAAAVRPGRFNHRVGVFPPDVPSRVCRLVSQMNQWKDAHSFAEMDVKKQELERDACRAIRASPGIPAVVLCKPGWFVAPSAPWHPKSAGFGPWASLDSKDPEGRWPMPDAMRADPVTISSHQHGFEQLAELRIIGLWNQEMLKQPEPGTDFDWPRWIQSVVAMEEALTVEYRELDARLRAERVRRLQDIPSWGDEFDPPRAPPSSKVRPREYEQITPVGNRKKPKSSTRKGK